MKFRLLAVLILVSLCTASFADDKDNSWKKDHPAKNAANYNFDLNTPMADRVAAPPEMIIDFYTKFDEEYITEDAPYLPYTPTEEEMREVRDAINKMPAYYKNRLRPRLMAIYFIENFTGSGMADFAFDKDGNVYYFMLFNSTTLKNDASEWITSKEKSAFVIDDPSYDLKIDIGSGISGFYYILYHEITHVLDYIEGTTPGEPGTTATKMYETMTKVGSKDDKFVFVNDIWAEYDKPVPEYDFEGRSDITFYGINDGPKLKISEAPQIYDRLQETPFVTLYGALSWMEDLSEFMAMYISTEGLGRPWKLRVLKDGEVIYEMKDVLKRKNLEGRVEMAKKVMDFKEGD